MKFYAALVNTHSKDKIYWDAKHANKQAPSTHPSLLGDMKYLGFVAKYVLKEIWY